MPDQRASMRAPVRSREEAEGGSATVGACPLAAGAEAGSAGAIAVAGNGRSLGWRGAEPPSVMGRAGRSASSVGVALVVGAGWGARGAMSAGLGTWGAGGVCSKGGGELAGFAVTVAGEDLLIGGGATGACTGSVTASGLGRVGSITGATGGGGDAVIRETLRGGRGGATEWGSSRWARLISSR